MLKLEAFFWHVFESLVDKYFPFVCLWASSLIVDLFPQALSVALEGLEAEFYWLEEL